MTALRRRRQASGSASGLRAAASLCPPTLCRPSSRRLEPTLMRVAGLGLPGKRTSRAPGRSLSYAGASARDRRLSPGRITDSLRLIRLAPGRLLPSPRQDRSRKLALPRRGSLRQPLTRSAGPASFAGPTASLLSLRSWYGCGGFGLPGGAD